MRTKELFLESADVGSQPNSAAIQLWNSLWPVLFNVKVTGLDLIISKISTISVCFGSNFVWDFPIPLEFPIESSFLILPDTLCGLNLNRQNKTLVSNFSLWFPEIRLGHTISSHLAENFLLRVEMNAFAVSPWSSTSVCPSFSWRKMEVCPIVVGTGMSQQVQPFHGLVSCLLPL